MLDQPKYILLSSTTKVFVHGATVPSGPGRPQLRDFTITLTHTTLGRTFMDE
jgi:hypothetical protein